MESAVISTTRKGKIFFFLYSGCLNPLSSKCLPERLQTETSQQIDIRAYWSSTNWQTTQAFIVQQLFRSSLNKILAHKQNSWVPTLCNNIYQFFFMVQFSSLQTKRVQQEHGLTLMHQHPAWPDEKLVMTAWAKSACKRKSFFCLVG